MSTTPDPQAVREIAREYARRLLANFDHGYVLDEILSDKRFAHLLTGDEDQDIATLDPIAAEIKDAAEGAVLWWPAEQPQDAQPERDGDDDMRAVPTFPEDKRGRYLDSEGIGAGAEGSQLITWGGDIDQIEVRAPHRNRVFMALGMTGLDPYRSTETCPQVRLTLTDGHARQLADGIYAALDARDAKAGER